MRLKFCLFLAFFFIFFNGYSQRSVDDFNENFVFNVHSVDEFFDRFNFKINTPFTNYIVKNFPNTTLKRERLIISLLNKENVKLRDEAMVKAFVSQVTDTVSPVFLNYSDKYWFAKLNCKVIYKGKPQNLNLILKVESLENNAYHWSVVSATSLFLNALPFSEKEAKIIVNDSLNSNSKTKFFLSPVSHGVDFINIEKFFESKKQLNDFVYTGHRTQELNKLLYLIRSNQIKFLQTNSISYYMFQISGWIVKLNYFNRNSKNSGWLIDSLEKVSVKEKVLFLKSKLNVVIM